MAESWLCGRYLFIATEAQANCTTSNPAIQWAGKRPEQHKLNPALSELTYESWRQQNPKLEETITLYVALVSPDVRHGQSAAA
eukprot:141067-Rhodomonas_salina.3